MKINVVKDGDGYLAKVEGHENLFAFAYSEKDALIELKNVVEMIMDYHLEQARRLGQTKCGPTLLAVKL